MLGARFLVLGGAGVWSPSGTEVHPPRIALHQVLISAHCELDGAFAFAHPSFFGEGVGGLFDCAHGLDGPFPLFHIFLFYLLISEDLPHTRMFGSDRWDVLCTRSPHS